MILPPFCLKVGIPVVINIGQAWIQDQVLKFKHRGKTSIKMSLAKEDKSILKEALVGREEAGTSAMLGGGTVPGGGVAGSSSSASPHHGQRKAQ